MEDFKATSYTLECVATGRGFADKGWTMEDFECEYQSLIRAKYAQKKIEVKSNDYGLYKFCDWLPIHRLLEGSSAPVTYKSKGLAEHLGLENLYITFSGYNPAIGANMTTCSFKETEAYSVCARIPDEEDRILVVASAGNTARAFAKVCSDNNIKLLLSVPADNLNALWFEKPLNPCVKLIVSEKGGDYFDAIHLSNLVLENERFVAEGGAKNIARRDGMGTTVLSAVTKIGRIPDYYFQAVGSGTGAIAAWEANMRFIEDGSYGSNTMKLMVSQNAPFVPMYNAWRVDSVALLPYDDNRARRDVEIIDAKVLSNRRPPYSIIGGLYDALKATNGDILIATNAQARKASHLFEELEGVDIHPAAAVALATLIKAVANGTVEKESTIMLNITGGGEELFKKDKELWYLQPSLKFSLDPDVYDVMEQVDALFEREKVEETEQEQIDQTQEGENTTDTAQNEQSLPEENQDEESSIEEIQNEESLTEEGLFEMIIPEKNQDDESSIEIIYDEESQDEDISIETIMAEESLPEENQDEDNSIEEIQNEESLPEENQNEESQS